MASELMKKRTAALDLTALEQGIDNLGAIVTQLEAEQGGIPLLRFTRDGTWVVGVNNEPVSDGTQALVHLDKLRAGYVAWKAGRPVGEEMRSLLLEGPVDPSSLPPVDAPRGWEPQIAIGMTLLDDGLEVEFKSSSVGGRQAFASLLKAIYRQRLENQDEIVPVVSLTKGQYTHPDYGVVYTPRLVVVDWNKLPGVLEQALKDDSA